MKQLSIFDCKVAAFGSCAGCICRECLYWWSYRCPYGGCWDKRRAKTDPYNKVHPGQLPRSAWSNWKMEQAYWCRGGIFYHALYCEKFIKYKGCIIKECLKCCVAVFQDGYILCSLVEYLGCKMCYQEWEEKCIN